MDPDALGLGSPSKAFAKDYNAHADYKQAKAPKNQAPKDMELSDQENVFSADEPNIRHLSGLKHLHNHRKQYMSTIVAQHGVVIAVVS